MPDIMNFDASDKNPTIVDRLIRAPGVIIGVAVLLGVVGLAVLVILWMLLREPIQTLLGSQLAFSILVILVTIGIMFAVIATSILFERKISAFIQDRKGPNRVGFWGVLQPMADGLKFLLKEEFTPGQVDRGVFVLAPCIAFVVTFIGFAIIPWAGEIQWPWAAEGATITTQIASIDMGILYILAVGGLGVYGVVLAGWASNCKYSFYGGLRAAAQMISYEVPMGLILVVVLLVAGSLRPELIVNQQAQSGVWNVFLHPLAFLLLTTCLFAEANRTPFDLVEAEQELVGGFHTEYSSMKFAMFFLGEYAHMITGSALVIALFLGGWHVWFLPNVENTAWWAALIKFAVYWAKIILFIVFFMVIRWTLPRFRFDQLMRLSWKGLIPMGMGLVVVQGALVAFGCRIDPAASVGSKIGVIAIHWIANAVVLGASWWFAARSTQPVTGRQDNLPEIEVRPGATV
jgi:NADH-quinone oxidoreductase subunit H